MHRLNKFQCFLFHDYDEPFDAAPKIAIEHQCRDGNGQTRGCSDQCLSNAAGADGRIANTLGRDRCENLDHADHRTQ